MVEYQRIAADWVCVTCASAGQWLLVPRGSETPSETVARHQADTRHSRCGKKDCAFSSSVSPVHVFMEEQ